MRHQKDQRNCQDKSWWRKKNNGDTWGYPPWKEQPKPRKHFPTLDCQGLWLLVSRGSTHLPVLQMLSFKLGFQLPNRRPLEVRGWWLVEQLVSQNADIWWFASRKFHPKFGIRIGSKNPTVQPYDIQDISGSVRCFGSITSDKWCLEADYTFLVGSNGLFSGAKCLVPGICRVPTNMFYGRFRALQLHGVFAFWGAFKMGTWWVRSKKRSVFFASNLSAYYLYLFVLSFQRGRLEEKSFAYLQIKHHSE